MTPVARPQFIFTATGRFDTICQSRYCDSDMDRFRFDLSSAIGMEADKRGEVEKREKVFRCLFYIDVDYF